MGQPTLNMGITLPWKLWFLPLCLYILMVSSPTLVAAAAAFFADVKSSSVGHPMWTEDEPRLSSHLLDFSWDCWGIQSHGLRSSHTRSLSGVKTATVGPTALMAVSQSNDCSFNLFIISVLLSTAARCVLVLTWLSELAPTIWFLWRFGISA